MYLTASRQGCSAPGTTSKYNSQLESRPIQAPFQFAAVKSQ
ncbi:hypothetical protein M3J09_012227 [Ascochyta lentis]